MTGKTTETQRKLKMVALAELCKKYLGYDVQAMGALLPLEINPQYIASRVLEHHYVTNRRINKFSTGDR